MKSRKRVKLRNIAEQEHRPARQFLNVLKTLIDDSSNILRKHWFYLRDAKNEFDGLLATFNEVNQSLSQAESMRIPYSRSPLLNADYVKAQDVVLAASLALKDVETDVVKRQWESRLVKVTTSLHILQMKLFNEQRSKDIDTYKRLRLAEKTLDTLQEENDQSSKCYVSSTRRVLVAAKVTAQTRVVDELKSKFYEPVTSDQLTVLQTEFDDLNEKLFKYEKNREGFLADALEKLNHARQQLKFLDADEQSESTRYYTHLGPASMRGVIRLYSALSSYKTQFDKLADTKLSNNDEVIDFQQRISATKVRLDKFMDQLWCEDFENSNATNLYLQFEKMDNKQRVMFMSPPKVSKVLVTPVITDSPKQGESLKKSLTAADKRRMMLATTGMPESSSQTHKRMARK